MRIINSGSTKFNVALGRGLRTFKPWNWVPILVAVPLLLTAVLWVMAPQLGQAQGSVPAQPTGLMATVGGQQATLSWDDPSDSGITGYEYLFHAQVAKLTASDGAANDYFGHSVAVDGDTAVVGTFGDGPGAAYVYTRQLGAWSRVAKLTASDGSTDHWFGYSVGVDGDTVVVGARLHNSGVGAAYVFIKPPAGWVTTSTAAKLTPSDGAGSDYFGESVAVEGDTVVVGAPSHDENGVAQSGAAYVFTEPGTGWVSTSTAAKLTASDGAVADQFGYSVAVDGNTLVAGAYGDDSNRGSAYVFTKPADGWASSSTAAKLTASDRANDDNFGYSVAVDGDTVVAGASDDDSDRGSAYVFTKPADGWASSSTAAKLTASDIANDDNFGISVALDEDTVLVGAYQDDDKGSNSGSACLFSKPATGWVTDSETVKLTASDGAGDDNFGISVALDEDTVLVGAYQDDDKGSNSGSAYVFDYSGWTDIPDSGAGGTNATSYTVTGLTNNAEYDFRIRAMNSVGTSPASDAVTVTPTNMAPTAVDDTAATLENSSVDINVVANDTDPDHEPTLSVTAVTTPANGTAVIASGSTTTVTYTPHVHFVGTDSFDYTLSDGTDTDTGTVTVIVGRPAAPTGLTAAQGGNGQVTLQWNDPDDSHIIEYQYSTNGGTTFIDIPGSSSTTTSYTITGLSAGVEYTIALRAVNASGDGAPATVTVTTNTPPTAVNDTVTTPINTAVDINVVANDTDPDSGTTFSVTAVTTPAHGTAVIKSGSTTTVTYTPPLNSTGTDGFDYTLSDGIDTDTGEVTVIVGVPAAPTGLTVTPGDGQLTLDWTDPDDPEIIKYQYSTDGGTTFANMPGSNENTTSYTVTGLTNDTEYTIAVRAVSWRGNGPAATVTATLPLAGPANLVVGEDSTRIMLQWDTGDPEITHYLISSEIIDGNVNLNPPPDLLVPAETGAKTTVEFTGLVNYTVQAAEVSGGQTVVTGPGSSVEATPQVAVPAAPTNLTTTSGHGQVTVTWDNPNDITIRKYQYKTGGGTTFNHMNGSGRNTTSFTFTGLDNGETYALGIRASNLSGESATTYVTAVPGWPAPTNLVAGVDSTRIVLQWDTGDPGITDYLVTYYYWGSGVYSQTLVPAGSGPKTTTELTSLIDGEEYAITVQTAEVVGGETVVAGASASVLATPTVAVPAAPTNLTATPGDGQVTVTWDNPGNITIRKYQYSTNGGTTFHHMNGSGRNTTSFTFTGLYNGEPYTLAIRASNLSGESEAAAVTATPSE